MARRTSTVAGATAVGVLGALGLTGCVMEPAGPAETRDVDITDVHAVELSTSGELTVRRGDSPSLRVTAGSRTHDRLVSEVRDGVLVLDARGGVGARTGEIRYELVLGELSDLAVSGSGDVRGHGVTGADLRVLVEGSGDVELGGLDATSVRVSVEGSGDVDLSGSAASVAVGIEGSGDVDLGDLRAQEADVSIEGSGEVDVDVLRRLAVEISGSGTVTYSGDPEVSRQISGSGDVRRD